MLRISDVVDSVAVRVKIGVGVPVLCSGSISDPHVIVAVVAEAVVPRSDSGARSNISADADAIIIVAETLPRSDPSSLDVVVVPAFPINDDVGVGVGVGVGSSLLRSGRGYDPRVVIVVVVPRSDSKPRAYIGPDAGAYVVVVSGSLPRSYASSLNVVVPVLPIYDVVNIDVDNNAIRV